jgi:hypothetical protein
VEVLPILEKFEEIYLWMDSDGPGQEGAEMFSKKIGLDRCLIVPTFGGCKDANEALLQNQDLNAMLEAAKVMPHESILQFDEIRSQVLHEIFHPDKYVGVPVPSLPSFTKLIKGFRRGEMTVLTGPTGRYVQYYTPLYIVLLYCEYQNIMYILYLPCVLLYLGDSFLFTVARRHFWDNCHWTLQTRGSTLCGVVLRLRILV